MNLQTRVDINRQPFELGYSDTILCIGSCFAQNIANKFNEYFIRSVSNPFGVLYNPASICTCLGALTGKQTFGDRYVVSGDGMYHSLLHHSDFSATSIDELRKNVSLSISHGQKALGISSVVILTLGTAWIYEYDNLIVANCHKLPSKLFVRRRLSIDQCADYLEQCLKMIGKDKKIILTVSPVRHSKDGLHENRLSKAVLMLAVEKVIEQSPEYLISYFPAYELLEDELRDYRYYADDMVHPSPLAVEYIWERFVETYMSCDMRQDMKRLHSLYLELHHRQMLADSSAAMKFEQQRKQKFEELKKEFPWIEM